jgi:hypothetical protein
MATIALPSVDEFEMPSSSVCRDPGIVKPVHPGIAHSSLYRLHQLRDYTGNENAQRHGNRPG